MLNPCLEVGQILRNSDVVGSFKSICLGTATTKLMIDITAKFVKTAIIHNPRRQYEVTPKS